MNPVAAAPAPHPNPVAIDSNSSGRTGRIVTLALATIGAGTGAFLSATGAGAFVGAPLLAASLTAGVEAYRKTNSEFTVTGALKAGTAGAAVALTAGTVALVAAPALGAAAAAVAGGAAGGVSSHALSGNSEGSYVKSAVIGGLTGGTAHGIGTVLQGIKEGATGLSRAIAVPAVGGAASGGAKVVENYCEGKDLSENVLTSIASGAAIASTIDVFQQMKSPLPPSNPTPRVTDEEFSLPTKEIPNRFGNIELLTENGPITLEQSIESFKQGKPIPIKGYRLKAPPNKIVREPRRTTDAGVEQGRDRVIVRSVPEKPNSALTPSILKSSSIHSTSPEISYIIIPEKSYMISPEEINKFACIAINPLTQRNKFLKELWNDLDKYMEIVTGPQTSRQYYIDGKQVNCRYLGWKHVIANEFIEGKLIAFTYNNKFFAIQKSPDFDFEVLLMSALNIVKNSREARMITSDPRFDSSDYPDDI